MGGPSRKLRQSSSIRKLHRGCETLESRWVLSTAPVIDSLGSQWISEGDELAVTVSFADIVDAPRRAADRTLDSIRCSLVRSAFSIP